MEAYLVALICRNTRTSWCSLSALCAHISHDRLQRLLYEKFAWSRRLWEHFAASVVREGGHLIIDETTWVRWAQKSEAVSWVWSSTHARTGAWDASGGAHLDGWARQSPFGYQVVEQGWALHSRVGRAVVA